MFITCDITKETFYRQAVSRMVDDHISVLLDRWFQHRTAFKKIGKREY